MASSPSSPEVGPTLPKLKCFGPFRLDAANHTLWRGGERMSITPKSFDVLRYLVENAGRLVSQNELLEALWQDTYVNPEVLRKYILEVRKILGDRASQPLYIETQTKRGYRFVAPVTEDVGLEPSLGSPDPETIGSTVGETVPTDAEIHSHANWRAWPAISSFITISLAVLLLLAVSVYFWRARARAHAHPQNAASIAVLPFADMSPDHNQGYFADGLSEQLINDLAKAPGLKVVGRSSAFQFKGKNEDVRGVGQKLGVANVLEGSVREDGNHVRITASLIKVDDGFQLWSESYDREINDMIETQDDIARDVTTALQVKLLSPAASGNYATSRSTNPEAYQAYLQGQYFVARGQNKDDLQQALDYANQSIKLDGNFAPAWAQRSGVLQTMANVALIQPEDGFRQARESAQKAIALDPNLPAGYLTLVLIQTNHDWDWSGAAASLNKAAALAPGNADVAGNQAYLARTMGHLDEAIELYQRAISMDPLRANFHLALGYVLYTVGRYDEALAALDRAEELNPNLSSLHLTRAKIFMFRDQSQDAFAEVEKETGEWEKYSGQALVYAHFGRRAESDQALKNLIATHQNDCAYQIAEAFAYRGETDLAFQWLERAIRQRDPGSVDLKTGPLVQSLRQDPRYDQQLKKIGLTR